MDIHSVNRLARAHNLDERKTVDKTKVKVAELKDTIRNVGGNMEEKKRKRTELEDKAFDWPSRSPSLSQHSTSEQSEQSQSQQSQQQSQG